MKTIHLLAVVLICGILIAGSAFAGDVTGDADTVNIRITVGDTVFDAQLHDNASARVLLEQMPLTLEMADYAGQEKVLALPFEFPNAETERPETIRAGELYLWSGNQLVLFYTTFANSYGGYVRLGAIEDASGLTEALGSGDAVVTLEAESHEASNALVVYFSCTGNTAQIAEMIAGHMDADLYAIVPEIPYTAEDLNYGNASSRANAEQNDPLSRPAISGEMAPIAEYDTIFLGYPIWWGKAPKIISTFLESHDFSGKTIVPFCTSGSSGIGSSDVNLHGLCTDTTRWLPGTRFPASASPENVGAWLDGLGIDHLFL